MGNRFSSGRFSIAECDRCGQRYKLSELKKEVIKTKLYQIKVCPTCWDPDHPQLQLGMYPVEDAWAVRDPRPDTSYYASGNTGLYVNPNASTNVNNAGFPSDGSREFQWRWNPVGGASYFDRYLTPNSLVPVITIHNVTVVTT